MWNVTHTERFCRKKLDTNTVEVSKEWGSWLRAPPRRGCGQNKSKWLREEGDASWDSKFGKDNVYQQLLKKQSQSNEFEGNKERNIREKLQTGARFKENLNCTGVILNTEAVKSKFVNFSGPTDDELTGLDLEERKRKRTGPGIIEDMQTEDV